MVNRRQWLGITLGAGATFALNPRLFRALQHGGILQRAIPSTGEMLPVIGLGSSATFSQLARREEVEALKDVISTLIDRGAKVFDTAPGYGASEQVAGDIANELGVASRIFWATKVNVAGRGGSGSASKAGSSPSGPGNAMPSHGRSSSSSTWSLTRRSPRPRPPRARRVTWRTTSGAALVACRMPRCGAAWHRSWMSCQLPPRGDALVVDRSEHSTILLQ